MQPLNLNDHVEHVELDAQHIDAFLTAQKPKASYQLATVPHIHPIVRLANNHHICHSKCPYFHLLLHKQLYHESRKKCSVKKLINNWHRQYDHADKYQLFMEMKLNEKKQYLIQIHNDCPPIVNNKAKEMLISQTQSYAKRQLIFAASDSPTKPAAKETNTSSSDSQPTLSTTKDKCNNTSTNTETTTTELPLGDYESIDIDIDVDDTLQQPKLMQQQASIIPQQQPQNQQPNNTQQLSLTQQQLLQPLVNSHKNSSTSLQQQQPFAPVNQDQLQLQPQSSLHHAIPSNAAIQANQQ